MGKLDTKSNLSRRHFLKTGAAAGGAAALSTIAANEAQAQNIRWNRTADVVIIGAGVSGLSAANEAAEQGASVIAIDMNYDIGGHGIMSGGQAHLGGGDGHQ